MTIYERLMQKAAEWRAHGQAIEQSGRGKLNSVCSSCMKDDGVVERAQGALNQHRADELETLAREVCAEARVEVSKIQYMCGADPWQTQVNRDIIGGPK